MALDVDTLETSFDLLAPRGDELVEVFYRNLFEMAPEVQPLFATTDMKRQRAMLLAALVLLRNSLRDLDALVPKLHAMGARHSAYGVTPEMYPLVGQVLLASMAELAGEAWNTDLSDAWSDAYGVVASAMLDGADTAQQLAAA
jgi:hemoglobin-like flavoprotein